ncbi:hypothetical protein ACRAWF_13575, partial [Streptomyces sp. L7]
MADLLLRDARNKAPGAREQDVTDPIDCFLMDVASIAATNDNRLRGMPVLDSEGPAIRQDISAVYNAPTSPASPPSSRRNGSPSSPCSPRRRPGSRQGRLQHPSGAHHQGRFPGVEHRQQRLDERLGRAAGRVRR